MPALDAYHSKQTAYEDIHTAQWHRQMRGFMDSLAGEDPDTTGSPGSIAAWGRDPDEVTKRLARTLAWGENFYVAPLMQRMVAAAAEAWPTDEVVEPEDFITDRGWLFIPGGVSVLDIRGQIITTSAISWERFASQVFVCLWADKAHDSPWMRAKRGWDAVPQFTPWHLTTLTLGQPLTRTLRMGTALPPEVSEAIRYVWDEADPTKGSLYFPQGWTAEQLAPSLRPEENLAWLVSTLRIMQSPLSALNPQGLPAAVRKGHRAARWRVKQTAVTVIDFRRRASDFDGHGTREYTHRFLRRGHWRRQPFKREDGTWDRRRIWIHPTVVGDPSLPLVLRAHVNSLSR